jgi:signal peptidase I
MDRRAVSVLRDLAREGSSTVVVRGACMEPLLHSGDALSVRARRLYLPGDVIVFRTPAGELAAHRVLGWRPAGLITKGDHCDVHDGPVARKEIVGAADVSVSVGARLSAIGALLKIIARRLAR